MYRVLKEFRNDFPNIRVDFFRCLVGFDDMPPCADMFDEFQIPRADALLIGFGFFIKAVFAIAATMATRLGERRRAIDDDVCVRLALFQDMLTALPE